MVSTVQNDGFAADLNSIPGMPPPVGGTRDFGNAWGRSGTHTVLFTVITVCNDIFCGEQTMYKILLSLEKLSWDDGKLGEISLLGQLKILITLQVTCSLAAIGDDIFQYCSRRIADKLLPRSSSMVWLSSSPLNVKQN